MQPSPAPSSSPPFPSPFLVFFSPHLWSKSYFTCLWLSQRHSSSTQGFMITVFLIWLINIVAVPLLLINYFSSVSPCLLCIIKAPTAILIEQYDHKTTLSVPLLPILFLLRCDNHCGLSSSAKLLTLQYDSVRDKLLLREQWSYLLSQHGRTCSRVPRFASCARLTPPLALLIANPGRFYWFLLLTLSQKHFSSETKVPVNTTGFKALQYAALY